jgi:hypothetical protein
MDAKAHGFEPVLQIGHLALVRLVFEQDDHCTLSFRWDEKRPCSDMHRKALDFKRKPLHAAACLAGNAGKAKIKVIAVLPHSLIPHGETSHSISLGAYHSRPSPSRR